MALAYAGLADCFVVAWDIGYMAPEEAYRRAKANATRALDLDDTIAEAHASLGSVYSFSLLWAAAEQEYRRAIELSPGYATAYQWRALNLSRLGRHPEAIAEARHAVALDPLSLVQNGFLGQRLYIAGDYAAAAAQLRKTIDLDPAFSNAHTLLGLVLLEQGELANGLKELERASQLEGSVSGDLGYGYGRAGDVRAAERVLNELLRQPDADAYQIGCVLVGLGRRAGARLVHQGVQAGRGDCRRSRRRSPPRAAGVRPTFCRDASKEQPAIQSRDTPLTEGESMPRNSVRPITLKPIVRQLEQLAKDARKAKREAKTLEIKERLALRVQTLEDTKRAVKLHCRAFNIA